MSCAGWPDAGVGREEIVHAGAGLQRIGRDGTIQADAGHRQGYVSRHVDSSMPNLVECLGVSVGQGFIKGYGRLLAENRRHELISAALREMFNLENEAE